MRIAVAAVAESPAAGTTGVDFSNAGAVRHGAAVKRLRVSG